MYFSLFCGAADTTGRSGARFGLTPREAWTFVALVVTLIGFGTAPQPLVASRVKASDEILRLRQIRLQGDRSSATVPSALSSH